MAMYYLCRYFLFWHIACCIRTTKGDHMPERENDPEKLREQAEKIEKGEEQVEEGKDPTRVAAGKKAAATRKEEGNSGRNR